MRVAIGRPLATRGGGYGELTVLFDCRRLDDAPFRLSDEIARAEFFHPDALPPMYDLARECLTEALQALAAETPLNTRSACAHGS